MSEQHPAATRSWRWLRVPMMLPLLPLMALGNAATVAFDYLDLRLR